MATETVAEAIDEFVRWATPVMTFRRTATRDVELHGRHIGAGDWVVLFYSSGNRDPEVFADPRSVWINIRQTVGGAQNVVTPVCSSTPSSPRGANRW